MKKNICVLLCVMSGYIFLVSCSAENVPKDEQKMAQNAPDEQETPESAPDEQETPQSAQGKQEMPESVLDEQETPESAQGKQETPQSAQGKQKTPESAQDEQEIMQNPQVPTGEMADAGNLLYEAFLRNETGVANPYVEGMNLTVMDDEGYESEFEDVQKKYAYVDVNGDENPELIFKISSYPSELMYILGIYDNELVCFDVFETHTKNISFGVYDYGFVWQVQNYDGFEMTLFSYTADGQPVEVRRFTEENGADIAAHEGEEPEWIDW